MDTILKLAAKKFSGKSSSGGAPSDQPKGDHLDKAVDLVQQHVLKEGSQKNESAAEQAKDAKIAGGIRTLFKALTGKEFPGSKKH